MSKMTHYFKYFLASLLLAIVIYVGAYPFAISQSIIPLDAICVVYEPLHLAEERSNSVSVVSHQWTKMILGKNIDTVKWKVTFCRLEREYPTWEAVTEKRRNREVSEINLHTHKHDN